MAEELELLKKRFSELARRSESGYFTFSDFLGLSEQTVLSEVTRGMPSGSYTLFGGAFGTERIMVRFGDCEALGYEEPFPIVCIKAEPKQEKFADRLTHRDFLGAILNLGIERSTLGDIPILDNVGYIFAKEEIAPYILESLTRVKHTDLMLSLVTELPEGELYKTEPRTITISSERLDAAVAKVFNLSREAAQSYFAKGLVFVDGRQCESPSYRPKENERISVRGEGRFIWLGAKSTTRKGKLACAVLLYV